MMEYSIPKEKYKEIEQMIASEDSVVGIDAKETHIIIIHMLMDLQRRIEKIEEQIESKA